MVDSQVYRVGVDLAMSGNMAQALGAISAGMLRLRDIQGQLTRGFNSWRPAILGAVAAFAGFEGLKGVWDIAKGSTALLDVQSKLHRQGLAYNDVLKATNDFYSKTNALIPTESASKFLAIAKDMAQITADTSKGLTTESFGKAQDLAVFAAKANSVMGNTLGGKMGGDEFYKFMRAAEMGGFATDLEHMMRFAEAASKLVVSFGGKLTPEAIQSMARRGGAAWAKANTTEDYENILLPMSVMAADIGGPTAGTMQRMMYQFQQGGGVLSRQQADIMQRSGLLDMSRTKRTGFGGGSLQLGPGAVAGQEYTDKGDLAGWMSNIGIPALTKLAEATKAAGQFPDRTVSQLVDNYLAQMFRNTNVLRFGQMYNTPGFREQIAKEKGIFKHIPGIDDQYRTALFGAPARRGMFGSAYGAQEAVPADPVFRSQAVSQQYQAMMEAIGSPLMLTALPVMEKITKLFSEIGNWANKNPESVLKMGEAITTVFAGLIALGTSAVLYAVVSALGPGGGLILAFTALAAIFPDLRNKVIDFTGALISGDWGQIKEKYMALGHSMVLATIDGAMAVFNLLWNVGSAIIGKIQEGIESGLWGLAAKIKGILDSINPWAGSSPNTAPAPVPAPSPPKFFDMRPGDEDSPYHKQSWNPGSMGAHLIPAAMFGGGGGGGGVLPSQFNPRGEGGGAANIHNVIILDGTAIANAINTYNLNDMEHPRQAAYFNGMASYTPPDYQMITA